MEPKDQVKADKNAEWRRQRIGRGKVDPSLIPHGTSGGNANWGCHCTPCATAAATQKDSVRSRKKRNTLPRVTYAFSMRPLGS